jgi:hypothetical protein
MSSDHFYTTSATERDQAVKSLSYVDEGIACQVFPSDFQHRVSFFRLFGPGNGDHFYTTSLPERDDALANGGYTQEEIACEVLSAPGAQTVPLFRLFHPGTGDHFYTTSFAEGAAAVANLGYQDEGQACQVFPLGVANTIPLFRLFNPGNGDHFYTTSASERTSAIASGFNDENIACFVFPTGQSNLYRLFSKRDGDHFYTTSLKERDQAIKNDNYIGEGIACRVPSGTVTGAKPFLRAFNPNNGDHFYTVSAIERDNAVANLGYNDEGTACNVFIAPSVLTVPLFRLLKTKSHVTVHIKDLAGSSLTWIQGQIDGAVEVYRTVDTTLVFGSIEHLDLPFLSAAFDVGTCVLGTTTSEQDQLFAHRNNANPKDVVVYVVQAMAQAFLGCAAHPSGQPGAVIVKGSPRWVLAHEVGHVLGLTHAAATDTDRLMEPSASWTKFPPDLIPSEGKTMDDSDLTIDN